MKEYPPLNPGQIVISSLGGSRFIGTPCAEGVNIELQMLDWYHLKLRIEHIAYMSKLHKRRK